MIGPADSTVAGRTAGRWPRRGLIDVAAIAGVGLAGFAGFVLLPNDLALMRQIAIAALFVMSLDLVMGVAGVATLGHAVLFGVPAYAVGLACLHGLTDPLALLALAAAVGAFAGALTGALIVRSHGLPQLVLSIALVQLVEAFANKASSLTGGSDGLAGIEPAKLFGLYGFDLRGRTAYLLALALVVAVLAALRLLVNTPFGQLCRAIKIDPVRVRALGVAPGPVLVRLYVLSGTVAGLAGGLSALTAGVVGLDGVGFDWSARALVMLALGGAGSIWGALTGAVLFTGFEHVVSALNPAHWLILVGGLLMAVTLVLPHGLGSLPARLARRLGLAPGWPRSRGGP